MLKVPLFPPKEENTGRMFQAVVTWIEDGEMLRQEHFICAKSKADAEIIAHNRAPLRLTKNDRPQPGDKISIKIFDYGEPIPPRTYYTSPIMDSSYSPVKPGPMRRRKIKDFDTEEQDNIPPKTPPTAQFAPMGNTPNKQESMSTEPVQKQIPEQHEDLTPDFSDEDIDFPEHENTTQTSNDHQTPLDTENDNSENAIIETEHNDDNPNEQKEIPNTPQESENTEFLNVLIQLSILYGKEISKIIENHTDIGEYERKQIQTLQQNPDILNDLKQAAQAYTNFTEDVRPKTLEKWFATCMQNILQTNEKEKRNEKENT